MALLVRAVSASRPAPDAYAWPDAVKALGELRMAAAAAYTVYESAVTGRTACYGTSTALHVDNDAHTGELRMRELVAELTSTATAAACRLSVAANRMTEEMERR